MTLRHGKAQKALPGYKKKGILPRHIGINPTNRQINEMLADVLMECESATDVQKAFHIKFRAFCKDLAAQSGLHGGVMIIHDFRLNDEKESFSADQKMDENRYRKVLSDKKNWRASCHFSPHAHIIGFGYLIDKASFIEQTGCRYDIYNKVTSPVSLIRYLLSHAPDVPGMNAYTFFGGITQIEREKQFKVRRPIVCKECIKEGCTPAETGRIIARMDPDTIEYKPSKRRRGRREMSSWSFEDITSRAYTRVQYRTIYRWKADRPRRPRDRRRFLDLFTRRGPKSKDSVQWCSPERWDHLVSRGVIPGDWFYGDPPPVPAASPPVL